jgi:hypothetical protein
MYGTVMIGKLADGATMQDYDVVAKEWLTRHVDGFVDENVLLGDDGTTVVIAVRFRDKQAYLTLADSPQQDQFYAGKMRPLLAADPKWYDGEWVGSYAP